jgi:hypothetical protein
MLHTTSDRRLPSITDRQRGWSGGVDPAVQTFVSSAYANITDPAQIIALNYLVTALKENGFWNRFHVLYPFIGGNSTSHRFNLIDPSLYAITFTGSFVHDSNGISGTPSANANATTGFLDSNVDVTNLSFAYYGTWNPSGIITFGNTILSSGPSFLLGGNSVRIAGGGGGGTFFATGIPGLQFASTSTGTSAYSFRNQFVYANFTRSTVSSGSWIIQLSRSASVEINNMRLAFVSQAYTTAEAIILEEIIEQYQELLGRQLYTINPNFDIYTNRFLNTVGFANVDSNQQNSLDYLITNLRNTTIFSKLQYLFPMVGTNAATQIRDVVQLASLGLSGSFTHTLSGMDPQTTSSFALTPVTTTWTTLGWTQAFMCVYINEQNTTNGYDWFGTTNRMDFQATNGSSLLIRPFGGATNINAANTTTTGFWLVNIPGLSQPSPLYRNGSIVLTPTSGSNNSTTAPYLFSTNAANGGLRRQALAAWGSTALTGTEPTDFNNIVQQYQILLGRA